MAKEKADKNDHSIPGHERVLPVQQGEAAAQIPISSPSSKIQKCMGAEEGQEKPAKYIKKMKPTRVCGISLGVDQTARIANISFIQAKEEAAMALLKAKQKLSLSSDESILEVESAEKSGNKTNNQNLEMILEVDSALEE